MKKLVAIIASILLFASCGSKCDTDYILTYRVYYGNTPTTKTYRFVGANGEASAFVSSDRGSNHLHVLYNKGVFYKGCTVESTSAPIEIVSVAKY